MQEGLKHFSEIPLMIFGMLLFFSIYIGAIFWTMVVKSSPQSIEKLSAMPLNDGEVIP